MSRFHSSGGSRWLGPAWVVLGVWGLAARVGAQGGCPPAQTITVTRPTSTTQNMCGVVRVDITLSAPPAGWMQGTVNCNITDLMGGIEEHGFCYMITPTTYCYLADTTGIPNAYY